MNLRQLLKFWFRRDTTFRGEFSAIWQALPTDAPKIVVDVGANDGFYGSNSYPFIARGWRALLIEPDPRAFEALERRFGSHPNVCCRQLACGAEPASLPLSLGHDPTHSSLNTGGPGDPQTPGSQSGSVVVVNVETLAAVLAAQNITGRYGVLSIDTEGHDFHVLRGAGLDQYRPDVIFTETFGPDESAKRDLLRSSGYQLRAEVDTNSLWTATATPTVLAPKR